MRPAFNIRGIRAGQVGDAAANAIPTSAVISIDFRLVPIKRRPRCALRSNIFLTAGAGHIVPTPPDLATRLESRG